MTYTLWFLTYSCSATDLSSFLMLAASFFAGMIIVNSVLMLLNLTILQSNVRAHCARPVPSVVVVDTVPNFIIRLVGVSTENVICTDACCMFKRSVRNLQVKTLPVRMEFVQHSRKPLLQEIYVLHPEIDRCEDTTE